MSQEPSLARLRYQSRRGMLELDVLLIPFIEAEYANLSEAELATYQQFLEEPDPDLYAWLMGYQACLHPDYQSLIGRIRARIPV